MSKTKHRRKAPAQQAQGGFNRFLNDMYNATHDCELGPVWDDFNKRPIYFKRQIYSRVLHIDNPTPGNEHITPQELKNIAVKIKHYYRERSVKIVNTSNSLSNYQLQLIMLYLHVRGDEIERQTGVKNHGDAVTFKELASSYTDDFYGRFIVDCCRIVSQMSNPAKKHYSISIRPAALCKDNPRIALSIEVYGTPVRKSMVGINGIWRPIYQMAQMKLDSNAEWIMVPSHLLHNYYRGQKDALPLYIQSHALSRLKERLDILDEEALNYALWENTHDITGFKSYKGYLLLPFKLYDIRIGYMVANIMDEKVVFRTFLFITHNCTPEGDKLRKITGLARHDITYWKIDRLSTFINLNMEKNTDLVALINEAGMSDLWQLKEKTFHIDTMQIANLDGLMDYIKKGKVEVMEPVVED